ncbi:hypothetical protein I8748_25065 [Nostoc sp. CENA67]|uniref:Uncharacterized protein n=1 Tax=Amazonocrinis nigriterrae CENA67 TaxID=2794033 RepID=A0A8J7LB44_9NOST|nr:hypothetical protein [Amazonocrinis nigriterrae]MBH8565405.1 hypothetical protein [Amazonocrinis nigriterrae CENA67]
MQPSYLSFCWLKTIEQSILPKKLFVKADTTLLQVITLMQWQLLLCDRTIHCLQVIFVHPWPEKSAKQRLVPSDIQQIGDLGRNTLPVSFNVVTTKLLFHPQMFW